MVTAGLDPEALERAAKALREINDSPQAKRVLELSRTQEQTRQAEQKTKEAEYQYAAQQAATERERVHFDELRKTKQADASTKAQLAQYEDELARKRMQAEHESQRARNAEMVKMQEESTARTEAIRQATEERVQRERQETDMKRAELERETIKQKALAEAKGRALEARENQDINRSNLLTQVEAETDRALKVVNAVFGHLGAAATSLLTDRDKAAMLVGGATALAVGVYGAREGARVVASVAQNALLTPALVRETSRASLLSSPLAWMRKAFAGSRGLQAGEPLLGEVVLAPALRDRLTQAAGALGNTRRRGAPFRNLLMYGPPGTGKTMAARRIADVAGIDYAMMSGGDVAPLGPKAVTQLHNLFGWAKTSKKGVLLFIDEADAFLAQRGKASTDGVRAALNALLYQTGGQSRDVALVLATNRPSDLDAAVLDRMDDALEFDLPGSAERKELLSLYFSKYIRAGAAARVDGGGGGFIGGGSGGAQSPIELDPSLDVDAELATLADRTHGFSGRELAKVMFAVQGAVHGTVEGVLTAPLWRAVIDYKLAEHESKAQILRAGAQDAEEA